MKWFKSIKNVLIYLDIDKEMRIVNVTYLNSQVTRLIKFLSKRFPQGLIKRNGYLKLVYIVGDKMLHSSDLRNVKI